MTSRALSVVMACACTVKAGRESAHKPINEKAVRMRMQISPLRARCRGLQGWRGMKGVHTGPKALP